MDNEWTGILWAGAWQVTLLILAVAVLSRWAGRNHPHFAHALWVVVLIKAVTPPIWSSPSGVLAGCNPPSSNEEPVETIADSQTQTAAAKPGFEIRSRSFKTNVVARNCEWPESQIISPKRNEAFQPIVIESEPAI